ncbi:probable RNA-binding protein EIF1AD [Pimephales promelas]|uniref:probable RNA-binding protein EIF1AD n=1 Tax=Pimephales promelas TaxID=90988 RepID=UPI0019559343|nr:probable RNA-binding protein EIF1AD [Pimephales promelas]XP_039504907.1 probable RNA-binding protein EIF1AD [Pimephales promelas]
MSKATKRKHVVKELLEDYITPTEDQNIMRVLGSNGNNLHEAVTGSGERYLVSMPTKFRKNLWIKRGDFVIVDPIKEGEKVKGEISFILYRDHIQYLRKLGVWPAGFQEDRTSDERNEETPKERSERKTEEEDSDSEDDDSDLFVNTNRATVLYSESEEETDEDDEEKEDEGRA